MLRWPGAKPGRLSMARLRLTILNLLPLREGEIDFQAISDKSKESGA